MPDAKLAAREVESAVLTANFPRTDAEINTIIQALNTTGFVCLENVVRPEWLARARGKVESLIEAEGEKYFSVVRPADESGSAADEMVHDLLMQSLLRQTTAAVCSRGVVEFEDVFNVLRIISGSNGNAGSYQFHYDASVITALVPLFIPDATKGKSGELLVFPNQRKFRRSTLVNIAEKIFFQNGVANRRATRKVGGEPERYARYLTPGSVYLFWGYRSYHANMPCAANALRATLLIHYGNPHGNSLMLRGVRNGRRAVEALRRKWG